MSRSSTWSNWMLDSWSARINPDPRSSAQRPSGVTTMTRLATITLIAALPVLISRFRPAASGPELFANAVSTGVCLPEVPLRTQMLAAPTHDPCKSQRACFAKRVPSRPSEPSSRPLCRGPVASASTCRQDGSWSTADEFIHALHRGGSPQGVVCARGAPPNRAVTVVRGAHRHGLQDADSARWTGRGAG